MLHNRCSVYINDSVTYYKDVLTSLKFIKTVINHNLLQFCIDVQTHVFFQETLLLPTNIF